MEPVDFVGMDAFIGGLGDRQVETSKQLSHRLSPAAEEHGHSPTAITRNRHTTGSHIG